MISSMKCFLSVLVFINILSRGMAIPKSKDAKCAVCRALVTELSTAIRMVDPRKTIEVGSYRINADGNQKLNTRPYAGSETHMNEVLESVCARFKDYAQGHHKRTGQLEVVAIVGADGQMNPHFSEYDMVQDPDLNKSLPTHCDSIVEDHEDTILAHFSRAEGADDMAAVTAVCQHTQLCPRVASDEL